jgi:hypothetical protein
MVLSINSESFVCVLSGDVMAFTVGKVLSSINNIKMRGSFFIIGTLYRYVVYISIIYSFLDGYYPLYLCLYG